MVRFSAYPGLIRTPRGTHAPPCRLFGIVCILLVLAAGSALAAKSAKKAAPEQDPNAGSLADFFKGEATQSPSAMDFQIFGGYADFRGELPEASGRYFMAGQTISSVAPDIYKLDLTFKRKYQRDIIDFNPEYFFTQQRTYYFWYNGGNKIVFKVGGSKKVIKIARKELIDIKVKTLETYSVEKQKQLMDIQLQDGGATIYLQLKFI